MCPPEATLHDSGVDTAHMCIDVTHATTIENISVVMHVFFLLYIIKVTIFLIFINN